MLDVVVHSIEAIDSSPAQSSAAEPAFNSARLGPDAAGLAAAAQGEAAAAALADDCVYEMPAEVAQRVVLVDSAAGLQQLEQALFEGSSEAAAAAAAAAGAAPTAASCSGRAGDAEPAGPVGFGGGGGRHRLVVGLDCEWQPYRRGEPRSRVSLLQLATPHAVFLLDLLALCGAGGGYDASGSADGSCGSGLADGERRIGSAADAEAAAAAEPAAALPPLQHQLSGVLARLFGDADIVVVGFGLANDFARLCESYPHLSCFGSAGPVPLRCAACGRPHPNEFPLHHGVRAAAAPVGTQVARGCAAAGADRAGRAPAGLPPPHWPVGADAACAGPAAGQV